MAIETKVAAVTLLLLSLAVGCGPSSEYDGPVRHVVFISLDTTRADHFGFYGNARVKTPRMDRLASESIVFDDFMTVVPTTLASHASLFSGKYPHSHGTPRNGFTIHEDNVLLAELLRDRGFATAGFVASFPLERRFGIARGFKHYDDASERTAAEVTDAVIEYLEGREEKRNLFLFAHYFDPHVPYEAPPPYDTLYDPRGGEGLPPWEELIQLCGSEGPSEVFKRVRLQYAGEISYMDEQVGRLLDALAERGILEEALLVVTSDHGELFREHPEATCFDHGWLTFQQDVRAVGLIRLPGAEHGGTRVGELVANIDILPAVLDLLGIPVPDGIEGESFDLLHPERVPSERVRFTQATKPWKVVETDPRWLNMLKARSVRRGNYKFMQVPYAGYEALYDLAQDPRERVNLLVHPTADARALAEELRAKLEAWAASADPLPSTFVEEQRQEVLDRLRKLGYLGEP